ncbi:MAG TPA: hypothetical protein VNL70_11115, partial [Tepidisphaeraceae bacterium]|nr:hypothetical protein [Tepidisphaeraceae bacterium]
MFLTHDARSSFPSCSVSTSPANPATDQRRVGRARLRRRLLVLAGAAAVTAPVAIMRVSHLWAQSATPLLQAIDQPQAHVQLQSTDNRPPLFAFESPAQPMGNRERLARGIEQYNKHQYEEALANLQQVDPNALGPKDQQDLREYLARAESAAAQRKAARAQFELGEQALAANNPAQAVVHYRAAMNNRFVDEGTRAKAREQMAVAEAAMKQAGQSLKDLYAQAVADYKAGNLAEARSRFQQLVAANYRAGLFQKSPADYLKEIDKRMPAAAAAPPPPAAPTAEQTAQPPTPVPRVAETPAAQQPPVELTPPPQPPVA